MSWFAVDDKFWGNTKALSLPYEAIGLWTLAGAFSADQLTDGFIPEAIVAMLDASHNEASASRLVEAKPKQPLHVASLLVQSGLWERVEGGYQFHNWSDYQFTKKQVLEKKKNRSEAGRKGGLKSGLARRNAREASAKAGASSKTEASASRLVEAKPNPIPSHPIPFRDSPNVESLAQTDADATVLSDTPPTGNQLEVRGGGTPTRGGRQYTDEFEKFWKTYPRKVGKAEAAKAFTKLLKGGQVDADQLTAAAQAHAQAWHQSGTSQEFIPHASTWLNKGRWSDEPEVLNRTGDGRPTAGLSDDQWQQAWERAQILDADDDTQPPSPGWP